MPRPTLDNTPTRRCEFKLPQALLMSAAKVLRRDETLSELCREALTKEVQRRKKRGRQ